MLRRILLALGLGAALGLDAQACRALLGEGLWPDHLLREFILAHALSIGLAAVTLGAWFPPAYRQAPFSLAALVVGFCAPLPLVGLVFLVFFRRVLTLPPPRNLQDAPCVGEKQVLTQVEARLEPLAPPKSVVEILRHRDASARRDAVVALRGLDPKKALPLLQKAIQDSDEQVRLLAQSQFNRILVGLELAIKYAEARLVRGKRQPKPLLRLAERYHELVYLGLSSPETELVYLERAIVLLREALSLEPESRPAWFLMLRCALRQRSLALARECLTELATRGYQRELLSPWEAEVLFLERDWPGLARQLTELRGLPMTPASLRGLCELWLVAPDGQTVENRGLTLGDLGGTASPTPLPPSSPAGAVP